MSQLSLLCSFSCCSLTGVCVCSPRPSTSSLALPNEATERAPSAPSSPLLYLRALFATPPVAQSTPVTSPSRRLIAPVPRSRLSAATQVSFASSSNATAPQPTSFACASSLRSAAAALVISEGDGPGAEELEVERAVEGTEGVATSRDIAEVRQGADVEMLEVERDEVQKEEKFSCSAPATEAVNAHK